ncbi:hypothetical protein HNW77_14360 [Komagataeibacter sp. AV436]|uniref:Uncharacterized protein n=1 Tax=Komagataeibacter melomenusus TaxID=2766578 RepID=A0ABX2AGR9_9PROT|nr:hypothetical protein [Komagataeibacter melomenusus]MBV1831434.1 hypothetical protein [Komagataeibacter melomenusus]NPC67544.1 hypothetical protein [Komagataeibacter melomenusus]
MSSYNDFLSFSKEEDQSPQRDEVNETAFRQALERLGKGKPAPRGPSTPKAVPAKARPVRQADPTQRRRKFVQDGDVRVEHHSLTTGRASPRVLHAQPEDRGETEQLRHKIQFEQKLREEAELRLSEAQAQIRSLTTRIGHADVIAAENKTKLAERDAEILSLRAEIYAAREEADRLREEASRLKARSRAVENRIVSARPPQPGDDATDPNEPEPVKWW